tara:strand:+ start:24910 stop:25281 length:372 start_codon:yes stop_codon:yes gene_type:complete
MARTKKQRIEISSNDSLQNVMQEVYNNACNQMQDAQKVIVEIGTSATPEDVDDWAKVAKAKTDALKLKDSAIKIKLDVGKLQSDIIKHGGNLATAIANNSEIVNKDSFAKVRELIESKNSKSE